MNWQNVKHMIQTTYQPIIGLPYSLYYAFSQWNTTQKETKAFQKGVELSEEEVADVIHVYVDGADIGSGLCFHQHKTC